MTEWENVTLTVIPPLLCEDSSDPDTPFTSDVPTISKDRRQFLKLVKTLEEDLGIACIDMHWKDGCGPFRKAKCLPKEAEEDLEMILGRKDIRHKDVKQKRASI